MGVFWRVGDVLAGESETAIQARHELEQLGDVLELRAATRQHDAADELVAVAGAADFVVHVLDDFGHARFDDLGEGLQGDLLGLASSQARDANDLIGLGFLGQGRAKFLLQLLRLTLHDLASLTDVIADDVAAEGNDRGVADDAVLENGDVRCAASDVDQGHACFLFFLGEHRGGGGERFEDELVDFKACLADALVDVLGCGHLAGDDVEVRFEANAAHANGVLDALFVVHREFLGNDVQDFFPGCITSLCMSSMRASMSPGQFQIRGSLW